MPKTHDKLKSHVVCPSCLPCVFLGQLMANIFAVCPTGQHTAQIWPAWLAQNIFRILACLKCLPCAVYASTRQLTSLPMFAVCLIFAMWLHEQHTVKGAFVVHICLPCAGSAAHGKCELCRVPEIRHMANLQPHSKCSVSVVLGVYSAPTNKLSPEIRYGSQLGVVRLASSLTFLC